MPDQGNGENGLEAVFTKGLNKVKALIGPRFARNRNVFTFAGNPASDAFAYGYLECPEHRCIQ